MKKNLFVVLCMIGSLNQCFGLGLNSTTSKLLPIKKMKWGEYFERPSPWNYGATFGLNFIGNSGFVFNVGGSVSYRAGRKVFLGYGPGFNFVSQRVEYQNVGTPTKDYFTYNSTFYDNSVFMRWFFWRLKFLQIEPGFVNTQILENYYYDVSQSKIIQETKRINVPYVLGGFGFVIPFADEKFFIMRIMYDVLQKENSPYKGLPIIRGGLNIGI